MQHQCCKHKTDLTGEMLALENKKHEKTVASYNQQ